MNTENTENTKNIKTTDVLNDTNHENDMNDEIDESFNTKPIIIDLPAPLSNDELKKLDDIMQKKSNNELKEYISELMISNQNIKSNDKLSDIQKIQIHNETKKAYGDFSKKKLTNLVGTLINDKNKYVIFENADDLKTMTEKQKITREELKQKLQNKIKQRQRPTQKEIAKNITDLQKMADIADKLDLDTGTETNIETNTDTNIDTNMPKQQNQMMDINKILKKVKKNNKSGAK